MNAEGRKRLDGLIKRIEEAAIDRAIIDELLLMATESLEQYKETFADIATEIEEIKDEEQEKYDNMPEGLQQGDRGQAIETAISALDSAYDACREFDELEGFMLAIDADEIITQLDEAKAQ